jgi:hypothetical protein
LKTISGQSFFIGMGYGHMGLGWAYGIGNGWEWDFREWDMGGKYRYDGEQKSSRMSYPYILLHLIV